MWQDELSKVLESWRGTPYLAGAAGRGMGVDCRYFVVSVMDELTGTTAPLPRRMPPLTSQHDKAAAWRSVRDVESRYPADQLEPALPSELEPGDVVLCKAASDAPAHILIMGVRSGEAWHATSGSGVQPTGIGRFWKDVVRVWRVRGREGWKCSS